MIVVISQSFIVGGSSITIRRKGQSTTGKGKGLTTPQDIQERHGGGIGKRKQVFKEVFSEAFKEAFKQAFNFYLQLLLQIYSSFQ